MENKSSTCHMTNEKRLIDANVLKTAFEKAMRSCRSTFSVRFWKIAIDAVNSVPTVSAVEVVHGRWIEDYETFVQDNGYESEPIQTGFVCSVCGRHSCSIEPYCHCGAKMDGGNEE